MALVTLPKADEDVLLLWKCVAQIGKLINALGSNLRIVVGSDRSRLTWTESNAILELEVSPGSAAAAVPLWQPYPSPFTGTGAPPVDQPFRIRVRPGTVNGTWLPGNVNVEIVVPANLSDPYFVWLDATVGTNGQITALQYGYGPTLPAEPDVADSDTGTPPSHAYTALFFVTSTAKGVNFPNTTSRSQFQTAPLSLHPIPTGLKIGPNGTTLTERRMVWFPPATPSGFPDFTIL